MKITISKVQWEAMGKQAGWVKKSNSNAVPWSDLDDAYSIAQLIEALKKAQAKVRPGVKTEIGNMARQFTNIVMKSTDASVEFPTNL